MNILSDKIEKILVAIFVSILPICLLIIYVEYGEIGIIELCTVIAAVLFGFFYYFIKRKKSH